MSNTIDKIKKIQYQFKKSFDSSVLTDQEKVDAVLFILNRIIEESPAESIVDAEMPTSFLGLSIDWSAGVPGDKVISVSSGAVVVQNDLSVDYIPVYDNTPPDVSPGDPQTSGYNDALALATSMLSATNNFKYDFTTYEEAVSYSDVIISNISTYKGVA